MTQWWNNTFRPWFSRWASRLLLVHGVVAALVASFLFALKWLAGTHPGERPWRDSIVPALKDWAPSGLMAVALAAGIVLFFRWFVKNMPEGSQDATPMKSQARMFIV